jgi:hypothetical protein
LKVAAEELHHRGLQRSANTPEHGHIIAFWLKQKLHPPYAPAHPIAGIQHFILYHHRYSHSSRRVVNFGDATMHPSDHRYHTKSIKGIP